jgi:hypothetical protein
LLEMSSNQPDLFAVFACLQYIKSMWGYTGQATSMQNYMSAISHGGLSFIPANNIVIGPITVPCTGYTSTGAYYNSLACDGNAPWGWQQAADKIAQQVGRCTGMSAAITPHLMVVWLRLTDCAEAMHYSLRLLQVLSTCLLPPHTLHPTLLISSPCLLPPACLLLCAAIRHQPRRLPPPYHVHPQHPELLLDRAGQ